MMRSSPATSPLTKIPAVCDAAAEAGRGALARAALLSAGLQVFSRNGFAKASTREICKCAQVNVAAISYHFGSKEALYKAVFLQPVQRILASLAGFDSQELSFAQSMHQMYDAFLGPLKVPELALGMQLHMREMSEPTGLANDAFLAMIEHHFEATSRLVARHVRARRVDEEVQALASVLVGVVHDYIMSCDINAYLAPALSTDAGAIDRMHARFVRYAEVLVEAEAARRAQKLRGPK